MVSGTISGKKFVELENRWIGGGVRCFLFGCLCLCEERMRERAVLEEAKPAGEEREKRERSGVASVCDWLRRPRGGREGVEWRLWVWLKWG